MRVATVVLVVAGLISYFPWVHWRMSRTGEAKRLADEAKRKTAVGEAGGLADGIAAYKMSCKFAGGEGILLIALDTAWVERDRERFDYLIAEMPSFGFGEMGAERIWAAGSREEFRGLVEEGMSSRH